MTARWDNIEILRAIDRIQQERYAGGVIRASNGMYLMVDQWLTGGGRSAVARLHPGAAHCA